MGDNVKDEDFEIEGARQKKITRDLLLQEGKKFKIYLLGVLFLVFAWLAQTFFVNASTKKVDNVDRLADSFYEEINGYITLRDDLEKAGIYDPTSPDFTYHLENRKDSLILNFTLYKQSSKLLSALRYTGNLLKIIDKRWGDLSFDDSAKIDPYFDTTVEKQFFLNDVSPIDIKLMDFKYTLILDSAAYYNKQLFTKAAHRATQYTNLGRDYVTKTESYGVVWKWIVVILNAAGILLVSWHKGKEYLQNAKKSRALARESQPEIKEFIGL